MKLKAGYQYIPPSQTRHPEYNLHMLKTPTGSAHVERCPFKGAESEDVAAEAALERFAKWLPEAFE